MNSRMLRVLSIGLAAVSLLVLVFCFVAAVLLINRGGGMGLATALLTTAPFAFAAMFGMLLGLAGLALLRRR